MSSSSPGEDVVAFYTNLVGTRGFADKLTSTSRLSAPAPTPAPAPTNMPHQLSAPPSGHAHSRAAKRARLYSGPDVHDTAKCRHDPTPSSASSTRRMDHSNPHKSAHISKDSSIHAVQGFRSGGRMQDIATGLEVIPATGHKEHTARHKVSAPAAVGADWRLTHKPGSRPSMQQAHLVAGHHRASSSDAGNAGNAGKMPSPHMGVHATEHFQHAGSSHLSMSAIATRPEGNSRRASTSRGQSSVHHSSLETISTVRPSRISTTAHVHYSVPKDNIGFKLLRQAGWEEGTGLGAEGTGRLKPVLPHHQKGNQGIGFEGDKSKPKKLKTAAAAAAAAADERGVGGAGAAARASTRQKISDIVAAELQAEDVDTKVRRHQQVMRQEKDDTRGKAIQQYIFRAFNEPDACVAPAPLAGPTRLTATNPLL